MAHYERLSAQDAFFLALEDTNCHQHVGAALIFEAGPLRGADGRMDIDRVRRAIESKLHFVPRFRQRLAFVPYENHPAWVDDDRFRVAYHVRHTALPRPGDERDLKRLVGRIMSQPLDRGRPLWEIWFVEGFEDDRFALISKTHHCMVDGVAGADLMSVILEPWPNPEPEAPQPWQPRPRPSSAELGLNAVYRRLSQPAQAFQAISSAISEPTKTLERLGEAMSGLRDTIAPALRGTSPTPLNVEVGPHRRFDWLEMRIADLKAVKNVLGGTLNDLVLTIVAGALRRFFEKKGYDTGQMKISALVPVSVRPKEDRGELGNRVAQMNAQLPVDLANPIDRLRAVMRTMGGLKESKQAVGAEVLTAISEWTVPNVLVQAVRLAEYSRTYNLMVTNVPGPQIPLYFLGCLMKTAYPVVTLFSNMALSIGLFSFNGGLFWGLTADWEQLPDVHDLVGFLEESFQELQAEAAKGGSGQAGETGIGA
ncbi:MAG: WS/DGAT/MGAT family O-acyltransferase [Candidatus Binatia bacterium]